MWNVNSILDALQQIPPDISSFLTWVSINIILLIERIHPGEFCLLPGNIYRLWYYGEGR